MLREFGPGPVLFGHSYGGLIAAAAAARAEGLDRLVLYEPPMGGVLGGPEWVDRLEALVAAGDRERALRDFLQDIGRLHGRRDRRHARTRRSGRRAWRPCPPSSASCAPRTRTGCPLEALARLAVPALLLVGSESPEWARRSTEAYAEAIPAPRS